MPLFLTNLREVAQVDPGEVSRESATVIPS
jgi:hypothetical protein